MILSTVTATLSIQSKSLSLSQSCTYFSDRFKNLNPSTNLLLLPKSLFPAAPTNNILTAFLFLTTSSRSNRVPVVRKVHASLLETPVLWAGRLCLFYVLLKAGLVGSPSNPILTGPAEDLGFAEWIESFQGNPDKEAANKRKLVSKWHPTTKGTLRRNYRVPSKAEGMRLLRVIAALLSEDDHFVDASSHKGCQIRRESAHGESVCCNNVRALFDELPTPHVVVEITAFPAGPLNEKDYVKAEKLERVLRSGPNI